MNYSSTLGQMTDHLPTFLVVGAAKSGTTSLFHYLNARPDVFIPERKECRFFSCMERNFKGPGAQYPNDTIPDIASYRALFPAGDKYRAMGDISNDYLFYHQNSVPAIREHLGVSINILIVLRNPVERAYSNYLHHVRNGWEPLPFLDALKAEDERAQRRWSWSFQYRRTGLYADPIAHFLESFTNVKTLLFEDLVSGPRGLREIHEFLGLPLEEVDFGRLGIHNATWTPRSRYLDRLTAPDNQLLSRLPAGPATVVRQWLDRWNHTRPDMDPEARTCLKDYFTEDLRRLQNLLNRDLSHWFQYRQE